MEAAAHPRPALSRTDRTTIGVIAVLAALIALLVTIGGIWHTIALAAGTGPVDLLAFAPVTDNVGTVTHATVTSGVLGEGSRTLLAISSGISNLVALVIGAAVVLFLVSIARGTPFNRILFPVLLVTGGVMAVGGLLASGLDGLGRMMAGGDLGAPYEVAFELEWGPWLFGFVVIATASVIRIGSRLQRDLEGLV